MKLTINIFRYEALRNSVVCKLQSTELGRGAFLLSGVMPREAAGGAFRVEDTVPPALPVYLLSEVFFAGRSPDDKYQSVFKDEKLSDYFL